MPKQKRTNRKDAVRAELDLPKYVGYLDCLLQTPVTVHIENKDSESRELSVRLFDGEGLLVPQEGSCFAPFESRVDHSASGVFSPLFLAENDAPREISVTASVSSEEEELCRAERTVTALPFDWWEGLEGNLERLAAFVRPRFPDCSKTRESAEKSGLLRRHTATKTPIKTPSV